MEFKIWHDILDIDGNTSLEDWKKRFNEATTATRYSIEINYRSKMEECLESFAKIVLGYVSAALKQNDYHVKHVFDHKPIRILISSRNWDDGEWCGLVIFEPKNGGEFTLSKGFYNSDRRSVSIQTTKKCDGTSAAEITADVRNMMHQLKGKKDRHQEKLKPIPLKRGPKR
jgi:hypothetical protein